MRFPVFTLLVLLTSAPIGATTLRATSPAELVRVADAIFVGQAVDQQNVITADGRFAFTYVTLQVADTLKGSTEEDLLTLRLHGGRTNKNLIVVEGMPRFELGRLYLLFVKDNGDAACPIVGWTQGQLSLTTEADGRSVLVSHEGLIVNAASARRWVYGPRTEGSTSIAAQRAPHIVDFSEGARAIPVSASTASGPAVDAVEAIQSLRDLIAAEGSSQDFRPGRVVYSASPADTPARVAIPTASPRR